MYIRLLKCLSNDLDNECKVLLRAGCVLTGLQNTPVTCWLPGETEDDNSFLKGIRQNDSIFGIEGKSINPKLYRERSQNSESIF